MASVSVVSSTDFRATLSQPQNPLPEGDEPFSTLLNSVASAKADAPRPEAPRVPERRSDAPAKQTKPEPDGDQKAKRRALEADRPENAANKDASVPVKADTAEESDVENDSEGGGSDAGSVDPLLMFSTENAPEQAPAPMAVVVNPAAAAATDAEVPVTPTLPAAPEAAPLAAAAPAAAAAPDAAATPTDKQGALLPASKPQFEMPATPRAESETEAASSNHLSDIALAKPMKMATALDPKTQTQVQTQPGPVQTNNATPLHGPVQLEMLNAAINKHAQLALGIDANEAKPDGQKPLVSSNAVAPNFAMTAQVNAPTSVQTQNVAEASRAVPIEQLGLEIATRASKGERRFDIRLDPPELGRIDVRLEIDSKGNTTTKLIVERSETLDMLQRDARGLEKALQNAGLKTDAGGMEFSLQQDTQTQQGKQNHTPEMRGRQDFVQAEAETLTDLPVGNAALAAQIRGGVDIRI